MELEDVWLLRLKLVALILTSFPMEFVSATVLQDLILTLRTESANLAHLTASVASPTLSAMLAMLAMTSAMVSVLLPP